MILLGTPGVFYEDDHVEVHGEIGEYRGYALYIFDGTRRWEQTGLSSAELRRRLNELKSEHVKACRVLERLRRRYERATPATA
jgi:hypothetical protein